MTVALYPGSFDPVTSGHLDITRRAAAIFDRVVVGIFEAPTKEVLFTSQERMELFHQAVKQLDNVEVARFGNLTVEFARAVGANVIVRGLRMTTDFEYEFEMALMNRRLAPDIDVVSLMTSLEYQYVSSSLLKEVARLGGDLTGLVPEHVAAALRERLKQERKS